MWKARTQKTNSPKLTEKNGFKSRKDSKSKKAYIVWEDNEVSSSSDSESDECSNLALMSSHHFDNEDEEVRLKTTTNIWYLDSGCSKHMT
jgi:hypothetical protein